jgi:CBS domain containing-hemolysin-like protein
MAGLVFATLGHRPEPDDTVTVDSVELTIEATEGIRITRLRVSGPTLRRAPSQ